MEEEATRVVINAESTPLLSSSRDKKAAGRCSALLSELVKPAVYGGMDGLVSVFLAVLIPVVTLEALPVVLSMALAKLFAGAFSMGIGELLSTKAEVDYARGERARETWECENFKEGEIQEMVELYREKGYSEATARRLGEILSQDDAVFVDTMMVEELEIPNSQESQNPWQKMLVNFGSFLVFGTVPVLSFVVFVVGWAIHCGHSVNCFWAETLPPLYISIGLSVCALLFLGGLKSAVIRATVWLSMAQACAGGLLSVAVGGGLAYATYY